MVDGDFSRVNSLATDTCSTMRSLWTLFNQDPDTKHVFTIPCDSHGLQLLIKNILEKIQWFKEVFNIAQGISTKFRSSPKQLSILRKHQQKRRAFIAAVITRWGTQLAMMASVRDNQEAIKAMAIDPDSDAPQEFKQAVCLGPFWQHLETLLYLFKPIHEAQKMSESDRARLSYVPQRWLDIYSHLHKQRNYTHRRRRCSIRRFNHVWPSKLFLCIGPLTFSTLPMLVHR
jgi:hypothetical protein